MKDNSLKNIIIVVVIIILFSGIYFVVKKLTENNDLQYEHYLKNYEVNEYIPTYITDEDMAEIYLNDYIHNMYYDIEYAYNSLDVEYRNKKFGNLNNYINYVNTLNYSTYEITRYYKTEKDGFIIFGVYDQNDNLFIFKTNGVMQYTVYLDDYTVEI